MPFGPNDALRNLVAVGAVDQRSARLWFRAERPGRYVVSVQGANLAPHGQATVEVAPENARDNTAVLVYPDEAPGAPALLPLHRYTFHVESEDHTVVVGEGAFETAPANFDQTPAIFSIGMVSCHQPYNSDGDLSADSVRLLQQLPSVYRAADIKFLLTVGDQIYADDPGRFSLLDAHYAERWGRGPISNWTPAQIRAAYQERYRICWNQMPWLKLLSSSANYAILDDHEVFDDWGSLPAHAQDPYAKIISGARLAYLDYQGSRQVPWNGAGPAATAFDYGFTYGTVATYVLDLRSERLAGPEARVISPAQLDRFRAFLAAHQDAHVVLVVTSVPLVHLPEWVTAAGVSIFGTDVDFPDHWSAPPNRADRNRVLEALRQHLLAAAPKQRLIVLGGDVHVGCAFSLHFVGDKQPLFYELTSSALSNRLSPVSGWASQLGPESFEITPTIADGRVKVSLLKPVAGAPAGNPIGGLNAGLIELRRNGDETNVRLKLIDYGQDHVAREGFVSGWL